MQATAALKLPACVGEKVMVKDREVEGAMEALSGWMVKGGDATHLRSAYSGVIIVVL